MFEFFTKLLAKISAVVKWFADLGLQVFKDAYELLTDVPCWVFDQLLGVAASALAVLDFTVISGQLSAFGSIPAGVLEVLAASGVGAALSIVATALAVRFALQLIPFVRLGS